LRPELDTRTLVVVATVVALVPSIIGALVWQSRRTYPGRWALGNILSSFALLFLSLRGRIPDEISIVLANTLAIGAGIVFLQGIRRFRGLPIRWWPECLLGAAAVTGLIYFRYVVNSIDTRILLIGMTLGSIGIACGVTLMKQMPAERRVGMLVTGMVFLVGGAIHVARGIYVFAFAPVTDLFDPRAANALFFLGASLAIVAWSFGFIVLTGERFETHAKSEQDDASEAPDATLIPEPVLAAVSEAEVREQLSRIVGSELFRRSARMERFLTLAVERSLSGRREELKEYALGRDVFNRGENYDPRTDSIVRVEAQRLRRKLREYYDAQGLEDAVVIRLPPGSYVPVFEYRQPPLRQRAASQAQV
jgi:hypothetical protein